MPKELFISESGYLIVEEEGKKVLTFAIWKYLTKMEAHLTVKEVEALANALNDWIETMKGEKE